MSKFRWRGRFANVSTVLSQHPTSAPSRQYILGLPQRKRFAYSTYQLLTHCNLHSNLYKYFYLSLLCFTILLWLIISTTVIKIWPIDTTNNNHHHFLCRGREQPTSPIISCWNGSFRRSRFLFPLGFRFWFLLAAF